jgi:hypothetical protein
MAKYRAKDTITKYYEPQSPKGSIGGKRIVRYAPRKVQVVAKGEVIESAPSTDGIYLLTPPSKASSFSQYKWDLTKLLPISNFELIAEAPKTEVSKTTAPDENKEETTESNSTSTFEFSFWEKYKLPIIIASSVAVVGTALFIFRKKIFK